jgi:23S rRNA (guanosine2251-2'-O)-methyltransferase
MPYAPAGRRRDVPWRGNREDSFKPSHTPVASPPPIGDDEEVVAGRRPVEEAFVARRKAHRLFVTPQRRQALEKIVLHATSLRIPIVEVEGGTLTAIAGFDGHQGVGLVVEARRYATLDEILARARERGEPPFVLVLDSLEDPQNVGTLLRSAEAAGVHGVLFPTKRQAPLSPAAVKASAGAVEHLLLAPVDDLAGALADLHVDGLRIVGAEAEAPLTARQADLRGPLALVVGSEGQGLGPAVRRRTDLLVRIPMRGAIGSLNASVAGSILLFEAVAQRDPDGAATAPAADRARSPRVARGLSAEAMAEGPTPAPALASAPAPAPAPSAPTAAPAPSAPTAAPAPALAPRATEAKTGTAPTKRSAPTTRKAAAPTRKAAAPTPSPANVSTAKTPTGKGAKATAAKVSTDPGAKVPKASPARAPTGKGAKATAAKAPKASNATTGRATPAADPVDDELLPGGPSTGRRGTRTASRNR